MREPEEITCGQLDCRYCGDLTIYRPEYIGTFCIPYLILVTQAVSYNTTDRGYLDAFVKTGSRELVPRIYFRRDRPSSRYQENAFPRDADEPLSRERGWRSERRGGPPRRWSYETCVFRLSGAADCEKCIALSREIGVVKYATLSGDPGDERRRVARWRASGRTRREREG